MALSSADAEAPRNSRSSLKRRPEVPDWAHEMKYDGYRIHARLTNGKVTLLTRTRLDRTDAQKITAQATCFRTRNP
jgi:ATP-dependent DNA ligase